MNTEDVYLKISVSPRSRFIVQKVCGLDSGTVLAVGTAVSVESVRNRWSSQSLVAAFKTLKTFSPEGTNIHWSRRIACQNLARREVWLDGFLPVDENYHGGNARTLYCHRYRIIRDMRWIQHSQCGRVCSEKECGKRECPWEPWGQGTVGPNRFNLQGLDHRYRLV